MKSCIPAFNIYLALASLFLVTSCASKASKFAKEEQSTMRLYLEGNRGDAAGTGTVLVTRERFPMTVEREPFLTEADLRKAMMVNGPGANGGYYIQLMFNDHGALLLDMLTTANKGRNLHVVVFSQFPHPGAKAPKAPKKPKKSDENDNQMEDPLPTLPAERPELETPGQPRTSAWLAAVLIRERNASGVFRFSPDATREETARIVRGLQNDIAYEKTISND